MSKRLFIAIPITPEPRLLNQRLFLMNNLSEERINWVKEENMHLTLKFIGKTQSKQIPKIIEAVKNCSDNLKPFPMILEGIGIFGSSYNAKVVWVGISKNKNLQDLHKGIVNELEKIGFSNDRQNFVPHFTLGRVKKINHKDHFKRVMEKTEKGFVQETMVNDFVLIESVLTADGPIYIPLQRFKLGRE